MTFYSGYKNYRTMYDELPFRNNTFYFTLVIIGCFFEVLIIVSWWYHTSLLSIILKKNEAWYRRYQAPRNAKSVSASSSSLVTSVVHYCADWFSDPYVLPFCVRLCISWYDLAWKRKRNVVWCPIQHVYYTNISVLSNIKSPRLIFKRGKIFQAMRFRVKNAVEMFGQWR